MIVLGIDPGKDGGWAIINEGLILAGARSPQMDYGKRKVTDGARLVQAIMAGASQAAVEIDESIVEMVGPRQHESSQASFSFGLSSGAALMAGQLCAPTSGLVHSTVWKGAFELPGGKANKMLSNMLVAKIFRQRGNPVDFGVKVNNGIAEAALIARWYTERRKAEESIRDRAMKPTSQKVAAALHKVAMNERMQSLRHNGKKQ